MTFIVITAIVMYLILIVWTWHSLGFMEKIKKIILIIIGIFLMYIITLLVFQLTKGQVIYENLNMQKMVQNVLVIIFTGVNGIIVMPQIGKILDKIKENEIEKEELIKRIIILVIISIICLIFETGYIKDIQEGILNIYHARK